MVSSKKAGKIQGLWEEVTLLNDYHRDQIMKQLHRKLPR